jgi:hypothetical protein
VYPSGTYSIVYLNNSLLQAAAYLVTANKETTLLFYIRSFNGSIVKMVPTVTITTGDGSITNTNLVNGGSNGYTQVTTISQGP